MVHAGQYIQQTYKREPLATCQGVTSLLRHSQEKNQAAEEEQGPQDQSGDQEGPVLAATDTH